MLINRLLLGGCVAALAIAQTPELRAQDAAAELINGDGKAIGTAQLNQLEQGVQILVAVSNLPAGTHAFHIHETGACEPPFESAGGHFNPTGAAHGWNSADGPHAGDLPNIYVGDDGALQVEFLTDTVTLDEGDTSLFDDDGSAILVHAGKDDYETDPAGDASNRIACGVIK